MGGQDTLRSYWKNYFEKTDALIWVVDATDRRRIDDCRAELAGLLLEEVSGLLLITCYTHAHCGKAVDGRESLGVRQQDRY